MSELQLPTCRHRGLQFAPGRWSCLSPRLVAKKGVTAQICNSICPCPDHEFADQPSDPCVGSGRGFGVAIGTFDSLDPGGVRYGTKSVELNLRVLRANCGNEIEILVCDDASPAESQDEYRRVCAKYGADFSTNSERMGHTSGDMIVYHKAILWARQQGFRTVTKLSQRMIVDVPNWVRIDSAALLKSGYATQAQMLTNFGGEQVRTECIMMAVDRWHCSNVLEHYKPRRIPYWNEAHTFQAIAQHVDPDKPYPHFLPWSRLSFIRGADRPPVYFRDMADAEKNFRDLATKHEIDLSNRFSTIDSCWSRDYE